VKLKIGIWVIVLSLASSCGQASPTIVNQVTEAIVPTLAAPTATSQYFTSTVPASSLETTSQPAAASHNLADSDFAALPDAILEALNAGVAPQELRQLLEQSGYAGRPVSVMNGDMTGDGLDDVVVAIVDNQSQGVFPGGNLLIYINGGDHFELAYREADRSGSGSPEIWFLRDLNADGADDLIFGETSCGAHTCFQDLKIMIWNREVFENRLQGSTAELPYPQVEIADPDADGIFDILVTATGAGSVGAGPPREITYTWSFRALSGYWEELSVIRQPPVFRIHAVFDADEAAFRGDYEEALTLYERVISDPGLMEWMDLQTEKRTLAAYAYFKSVIVNRIAGEPSTAQARLEQAQSLYPQGDQMHLFVEMAEIFEQIYGQGNNESAAQRGCQAVRDFVDRNPQILAMFDYGYGNPQYTAEDICPW
jgi:hypothetical protein